jgi:hypothetical protein
VYDGDGGHLHRPLVHLGSHDRTAAAAADNLAAAADNLAAAPVNVAAAAVKLAAAAVNLDAVTSLASTTQLSRVVHRISQWYWRDVTWTGRIVTGICHGGTFCDVM